MTGEVPSVPTRMGGDEFVVLVEDVGPDGERELRAAAECALTAVRRPVRLDGNDVAVTASIGIVQHGGAATPPS
jgi:GGDEF domain-containing protein